MNQHDQNRETAKNIVDLEPDLNEMIQRKIRECEHPLYPLFCAWRQFKKWFKIAGQKET